MEREFFDKLRGYCLSSGLNLNEILFEKIFYIINNNVPILKYESPFKVKSLSLYLTEEIIVYLEEFTLKNDISKNDIYYTAIKSLEEDLNNADEYYNNTSSENTSSKITSSKTNSSDNDCDTTNFKDSVEDIKEGSNDKKETTEDIKECNEYKKDSSEDKKESDGDKDSLEENKKNQKSSIENNETILSRKTGSDNDISPEMEVSINEYLSNFDVKQHILSKFGLLVEEYETEFKNNKINNIIKDFDKDKDLKLFEDKSKILDFESMSSSLKKEFIESEDFFNNICGHKLDDYQRLAAIADADNLQIIAGAGTGKTLTLISKVKYLVCKKAVDPKRILCLSFNTSSANELRGKLKEELGRSIETKTFHSLGLKIIGSYDKSIESRSMDYDKFYIEKFKDSLTLDEMKEVIKLGYDSFNISKHAFEFLISDKILSKEDKIQEEYNFVLSQCPLPGLIEDFMDSFKRQNYSFDKFYEFYTNPYYFSCEDGYTSVDIENRHRFLDIVCKFYLEYELYLLKNNMVDFSDMINKSIGLVELNGIKYDYDYILIDEYQDTSYLNYKLIRAIKDKTNCKVVVVGDDWQSIYGFRDTNIELCTDFGKYFKNPRIIFTSETYRNSQELIDVASKFVLSNNKQIKKNLISNVKVDGPPIKVSYINSNVKSKVDILSKIILELTEDYPGSSVYILGRNKDSITKYLSQKSFYAKNYKQIGKSNNLKITYPKNSEIKDTDKLDISFKTIHASKGLESDNVIIILDDKFPSTRSNHGLLNYVSNDNNHGSRKANEERRLFYVALSRTRNNVFIISDFYKKSSFMGELEDMWDLNDFQNSFEIYYNCNDDKD